jgi:hypothetical protein
LSLPNKLPSDVFYDTESKIISADYKLKENLHLCLDEDGNFVLRKINQKNNVKKIKLKKENYKYIGFNKVNDNQYFISSSENFRIFDIRTHLEIYQVEELKGAFDIFNDSNNFLKIHESGLDLFDNNFKQFKHYGDLGFLTHFNANYPEVCIIGNENGDIFINKFESN